MSRSPQPPTRLIFIEDLPGSGKTSLAEWLCEHLQARGASATWIPELARDHPVIAKATMRTARVRGYADRCITRWAAFSTATQKLESPGTIILEGCLFQSTVRFLVEHERCKSEIDNYLPAVEACLAPLRPCLVYLTPTDTRAYLETERVRRKGFEIVSRIASYSETVPYSIARDLQGFSASAPSMGPIATRVTRLFGDRVSQCWRSMRRGSARLPCANELLHGLAVLSLAEGESRALGFVDSVAFEFAVQRGAIRT